MLNCFWWEFQKIMDWVTTLLEGDRVKNDDIEEEACGGDFFLSLYELDRKKSKDLVTLLKIEKECLKSDSKKSLN